MRRRWLSVLAGAIAGLFLMSFAAAALLTEGALHPPVRRRASDTATLAYSIGEAAHATARQVRMRARDGVMLEAWWLESPQPSTRAVMVCHGVSDSAFGAMGYALLFLRNGYGVLVPESRGHGVSGGFVSYGVQEGADAAEWTRWMKRQGAQEVFGFGESLGAAIVLQSLLKGAEFQAVVAESPYASFESVAEERVAPRASVPLAWLLVKEGMFYAQARYGVNLGDARTDTAVAGARIPILLIHGLADDETNPMHSRRLAALNVQRVTLWLVPDAKHTGAYAADPQQFENRVLGWFSDNGCQFARLTCR